MNPKQAARGAVVGAMKQGGYWDAVMGGGPSLERVAAYLRSFESEPEADPLMYPDYPVFPGLSHAPFRQPADLPGVARLEADWRAVREEWQSLGEADFLRYEPAAMTNTWQVHLLHYMGLDLEAFTRRCPLTHALLREVPGLCLNYPWADALLSVHAGQSHLKAHCSVDAVRVRCHLPLSVPGDCAIRVGTETREWQEGRALLFEDAFEHEVWNRSDSKRAILILDFWHPGLTAAEREALVAGFAKSEVRSLFMAQRLQAARPFPEALLRHLREALADQDRRPAVRAYWHS